MAQTRGERRLSNQDGVICSVHPSGGCVVLPEGDPGTLRFTRRDDDRQAWPRLSAVGGNPNLKGSIMKLTAMSDGMRRSDTRDALPRRRGAPVLGHVVLFVCAVTAAFAFPVGAQAGSVGRWEPIAPQHDTTVLQPALARDAAARLHVAYVEQRPDGALDLSERAIAPAGTIGGKRPVLTGFTTLADPALLAEPGGLRVLVGGQRSINTEDPLRGLLTATAPVGDGGWSAPAVTTPQDGEAGFASGDATAVSLADGAPLALSSGSGFGVLTHRGLDPAIGAFNLQDPFGACCIGQAQIVREATSGTPLAVYQSVISGRDGVFVQALNPATGGPAAAPVPLPGLGVAGGADAIDPVLARTAAAARVGGGVFVAVPSGLVLPDRTRLWRAGGTITLGSGGGRHFSSAVVPTPDGRLWVAWSEERPNGLRIVLRRSNPTVSRFGEQVTISGPPGAARAFALDGSSQALRLDLVATAGDSGSGPSHTQVLPPLELRAAPSRIRGGRTTSVRFTVTDVGVPVAGASVSAGGRRATTSSQGTATLRLRGGRTGASITVKATRADYRTDTLKVKVRRAPKLRKARR